MCGSVKQQLIELVVSGDQCARERDVDGVQETTETGEHQLPPAECEARQAIQRPRRRLVYPPSPPPIFYCHLGMLRSYLIYIFANTRMMKV